MTDDVPNRFFVAIIMGDLATVKDILPGNPGAVSWVSPGGYPPLHMAILNQRPDIAVCLVEQGADIRQKAQGETAVSIAERKGMRDILEDASRRQAQVRRDAVEACGDHMRTGLKAAVKVQKKPLALKSRNP